MYIGDGQNCRDSKGLCRTERAGKVWVEAISCHGKEKMCRA